MESSDVNHTTEAGNSVTKASRVRVEDRITLGATWSWKWEMEGKKKEASFVSVLIPQGLTAPDITSFSERHPSWEYTASISYWFLYSPQ